MKIYWNLKKKNDLVDFDYLGKLNDEEISYLNYFVGASVYGDCRDLAKIVNLKKDETKTFHAQAYRQKNDLFYKNQKRELNESVNFEPTYSITEIHVNLRSTRTKKKSKSENVKLVNIKTEKTFPVKTFSKSEILAFSQTYFTQQNKFKKTA